MRYTGFMNDRRLAERRRAMRVALWCLLAVACATAPNVRFEGTVHPPSANADSLVQEPYVPHEHTVIGRVAASCERVQGSGECDEVVLLRAMREEAARVGATAFVAPRCERTAMEAGLAGLRCEAVVARLAPGRTITDATVADEQVWTIQAGSGRIRVAVRRAAGVTRKPLGRHPQRYWAEDPDHRVVGTIHATCVDRCERSEVEEALKSGAGWLGADYRSVSCHEKTTGVWSCRAEAIRKRVE